MKPILGNIPAIAMCICTSLACTSSVTDDGSTGPVRYVPVLGENVRSSDNGFDPESDFGVWATADNGSFFIDKVRVRYRYGAWGSEPEYIWPRNTSLRFIAYAPYSAGFEKTPDGLKIEGFSCPGADMALYATDTTEPLRWTDGDVSLNFMPLTSRIDFRIANGLNKDTDVRIEKIILEGVYLSGDFDSSSDPQWTVTGEKSGIAVYISDEDENSLSREMSCFGKTLELVPQNPKPRVTVVYSFSTAGSGWIAGQTETSGELNTEFLPGRRYTCSMTITEGGIKHTVGIGNWISRN